MAVVEVFSLLKEFRDIEIERQCEIFLNYNFLR